MINQLEKKPGAKPPAITLVSTAGNPRRLAVGDAVDRAVPVIRQQHGAVGHEFDVNRAADVIVVVEEAGDFTVPSLFRKMATTSPPNFVVRFHEP